jgi:DNA-directed RNA polymerase subunit M/transcription elongation factor TFIIS
VTGVPDEGIGRWLMEAGKQPVRTCPACGSEKYLFRHRKAVETEEGTATETKYRCRACEHEWKVRVPK